MTRPTISIQAAIGDPTVVGTPFIIGTSLIGGTDVIAAATLFGDGAWVELASRCYTVSTRRGRQRFLEQFRAGTLGALLDTAETVTTGFLTDESGVVLTDESGVPLSYETPGEATLLSANMRSGRAIRVVATHAGVEYPVIYAFADQWKPSLTYPESASLEVTATDAFKILTRIDPFEQSPVGAGDDTGTRIGRILDVAEWPVGFRDLQTGDNSHQATTLAQPIATQVRLAADSERGDLYVDARGVVTFRRRRARYLDFRSRTVMWTIGDGDGEMNPSDIELSNDDELVRNDVNVARTGGSFVSRRSIAGEDPAKRSTYTRTDLTLESDDQVADHADSIIRLFADAEGRRINSVTFEPDGIDDDAMWVMLLDAKFGDRVRVNTRHPAVDATTGDYFIEGIDHDIPVFGSGQWRTTFSLADASLFPTNPFFIGTSLIGGTDVIA